MYTLLCLGLAVATWGLLGLMTRDRKKLYAAAYLIGAGISIYSQAVALIYLAILNGLALASWRLMTTPRAGFLRNWLIANLLLFVISLPWLLTLREATQSFQGLPADSSLLVQWFFRNIVGFPGLPFPIKQLADALILLAYALGAILLWNSGRRTLAVLSAGALLIFPAAIALLNLNTPILANRIFIPSLIPAAMLFGCCVALLKRPMARTALLSATLVFAAWSSIEARYLQVKTEDTPQALALINAQGFGAAPILCSNFWTAGTAYFYAPNREILFPGVDDELDQIQRENAGCLFTAGRRTRPHRRRRDATHVNRQWIDPRSGERLDFGPAGRPDKCEQGFARKAANDVARIYRSRGAHADEPWTAHLSTALDQHFALEASRQAVMQGRFH